MWNFRMFGLSVVIAFSIFFASWAVADDATEAYSGDQSKTTQEQQEAVADLFLRLNTAALWKDGKIKCMNFFVTADTSRNTLFYITAKQCEKATLRYPNGTMIADTTVVLHQQEPLGMSLVAIPYCDEWERGVVWELFEYDVPYYTLGVKDGGKEDWSLGVMRLKAVGIGTDINLFKPDCADGACEFLPDQRINGSPIMNGKGNIVGTVTKVDEINDRWLLGQPLSISKDDLTGAMENFPGFSPEVAAKHCQ